jgi:hypothetical protein
MQACKSKKKKSAIVASLRPISWRCRHAEFLPISSERCTARHGVRSKADMQTTLRHPAAPSPSCKLVRFPLSYCLIIALCGLQNLHRCCPLHCSCLYRSRISDREFPATAAVTRTLALPPLIHTLSKFDLVVSANDTFSFLLPF